MSRATLKLARAPRKPSLALVKKALRLYKAPGIPKAQYRANARKWLAAMAALGERHILRKESQAKWGRPGMPGEGVGQVFASRRLGGAA